MHPFSVLTLGIFIAGYITARWDLVNQLYELAIFAWDHGVVVGTPCHFLERFHQPNTTDSNRLQTRSAKGFVILTALFFLLILPVERIAAREINLVSHDPSSRYRGRG